ncbi:MAG: hypothetical protein ACHQF2_04470 [Flavobacteriales bacterium]
MSLRVCTRIAWIGGILALIACILWGAFGLGALMAFLVLYLFPLLVGKKLKSPETTVLWMLLIESVFITGPLWLELIQV